MLVHMGGSMLFKDSTATLPIVVCAAALCAGALVSLQAQAVPGGRGGAAGIFAAADVNKDGYVTRGEFKALFAKWHRNADRSEEHTSELQSLRHLVCRLLLEKKKT